jgi:hypothetical protein
MVPSGETQPWVIDPGSDMVKGRTLTNIFEDLTGAGNFRTQVNSGSLPFGNGFPAQGEMATSAQLHNLIRNFRNNSAQNQYNVTEWKTNGYVVNWRLSPSNPGILGVMFDGLDGYSCHDDLDGEADGCYLDNNISCEGAAVSWYAVRNDQLWTTSQQQRQGTLWLIAHELGHTLKFMHGHSSCGGPTQCDGGTIMSYTYDSEKREAKFNDASQSNLQEFYKTAPEAWVRPGRYGEALGAVQSTLPSYSTY